MTIHVFHTMNLINDLVAQTILEHCDIRQRVPDPQFLALESICDKKKKKMPRIYVGDASWIYSDKVCALSPFTHDCSIFCHQGEVEHLP